jgi:hypothetical protein
MDFYDMTWEIEEETRTDLEGLAWAAGVWSLTLYIPALIALIV